MRRKPKNRTECSIQKFKAREDGGPASFYVAIDRERTATELGPVVGIRVFYKHAKGSDLDNVLLQISDYLSREVQTVSKELASE